MYISLVVDKLRNLCEDVLGVVHDFVHLGHHSLAFLPNF